MSYENLINVLQNQSLKLILPQETNDVFECNPVFDQTWLEESAYSEAKEVGFISFCSDYKSSSMWGLYGDSHKGICIEFEFPYTSIDDTCPELEYHLDFDHEAALLEHESEGKSLILSDVKYSSQRVAFLEEEGLQKEFELLSDKPDDYKNWCKERHQGTYIESLHRKDIVWQGEKEKRILFNLWRDGIISRGELFFVKGLNKYIRRILLGWKCSRSTSKTWLIVNNTLVHDAEYIVTVERVHARFDTFDVYTDSELPYISYNY
ncbi:DUF2971 domain-containing protein [Akkermansia sp.]